MGDLVFGSPFGSQQGGEAPGCPLHSLLTRRFPGYPVAGRGLRVTV